MYQHKIDKQILHVDNCINSYHAQQLANEVNEKYILPALQQCFNELASRYGKVSIEKLKINLSEVDFSNSDSLNIKKIQSAISKKILAQVDEKAAVQLQQVQQSQNITTGDKDSDAEKFFTISKSILFSNVLKKIPKVLLYSNGNSLQEEDIAIVNFAVFLETGCNVTGVNPVSYSMWQQQVVELVASKPKVCKLIIAELLKYRTCTKRLIVQLTDNVLEKIVDLMLADDKTRLRLYADIIKNSSYSVRRVEFWRSYLLTISQSSGKNNYNDVYKLIHSLAMSFNVDIGKLVKFINSHIVNNKLNKNQKINEKDIVAKESTFNRYQLLDLLRQLKRLPGKISKNSKLYEKIIFLLKDCKPDYADQIRRILHHCAISGVIGDEILEKIDQTIANLPHQQVVDQTVNIEAITITNAGLVIIWPYLLNLFKAAELLYENVFVDIESAEKACLMLQYIVLPETRISEHNLFLNKLLCGFPLQETLSTEIELSDEEKDFCGQVLQNLSSLWFSDKSFSEDSIRQLFLQRTALVIPEEDGFILKIDSLMQDTCLHKLPWFVDNIQLPWMAYKLKVKW